MPIYEYRCEDCGQTHDKLARPGEDDVKCPRCGSGRQKRLVSHVAAGTPKNDAPSCSPHVG